MGLIVETDLFAKNLKDNCKQDFKQLITYLNELNIPELKTEDKNFYEEKTSLTRILLQIYGTNIIRDRIDKNYWINLIKERCLASKADVRIITDVRFPNEIDDIIDEDKYHTIPVRISRLIKREDGFYQHPSETALDTYPYFHYTIDNNGTLEDLKENAKLLIGETMDIGV